MQKKKTTPKRNVLKKTLKKSAKKTVKKTAPKKRPENDGSVIKKDSPILPENITQKSFPIVGIGASAGGLEAMEEFFNNMPSSNGMAIIIVAHLSPNHISILPEILQKRTSMKVCQVKDNTLVEPDCVYVIPPSKDLSILNGTLQLMETTAPRGTHLPIDAFLRSLAQDQGSNAICVILSGTGTDGTLGLKEIKGGVGMVMVQDEDSAKYTGMPRSAIATGLTDYILNPAKMPAQLIKYAGHSMGKDTRKILTPEGKLPDALQKIYILLRSRTGHDFSLYKKNTICRRIERRMHVHQIDKIEEYVRYLRGNDSERDVLFKELLIGVTNFFRDPKSFEILQEKIIPDLIRQLPEEQSMRVWVPGCSTGEEAYSIAIVIHECMEKAKKHFNVQIFGTDIDESSVETARMGVYPSSISVDVNQKRLKRFFSKEEGTYRIKKVIREMLVFAPQDIIKDPPFTKLNLLSCRNLLIYMGSELQKKLLPVFHYSLKPNSALFLGSSESIGQYNDIFSPISKKWKIFKRITSEASARRMLDFPSSTPGYQSNEPEAPKAIKKIEELSAFQMVETILQQSNMPPCVIINTSGNIIYIHGRTGRFLEPAEGKISNRIAEMAKPGLKNELIAAIRNVTRHNQEVASAGIKVQNNGGHIYVDMTVKPILEQTALRGMIMVIFQETSAPKKGRKTENVVAKDSVRVQNKKSNEELELELRNTRENLQTTVEEMETSNEELKSTNEELQSTNEELQSTNEELETSKEELQSLNEESSTVNVELQNRIDELSKANDDMKNLLDSTQIATIFLDIDLAIRRFTPSVSDLIPLSVTDVGRPISNFAHNLYLDDLVKNAQKVLENLIPTEEEVQSKNGEFYHLKIQPYRTTDNVIDGVVITFENITKIKETANKLRRLAAIVMDSNDAITVQDFMGNITAWNKGAVKMYGYSETEAMGMNITDIIPEEKKAEALRMIQKLQEEEEEEVESFKSLRITKTGEVLEVWLTVTKLTDDLGKPVGLATTERNITNFKK